MSVKNNKKTERSRDERSAKEYAFKLLGRRDYTTLGLKTKLEKRGYTRTVISSVIRYLTQINLLDDRKFASRYAIARLKIKPRGPRVLEYELFKKGIPREFIKEIVPGLYREMPQESIAKQVIEKEIRQKEITEKVRQKIYQKLLRLGFSFETIEKVTKSLQIE